MIPTDDLVGTKRVSARERRGFQLSFRNYIREDAIPLLTRNIPQWSKEGLWHEKFAPGGDLLAAPGEGGLAHVYSCICRFESRMGNDAIRTRAAMVILQAKYDALIAERLSEQPCIQGARRGRGYASVMVDRLLQSIHPGWETANKEHKAELRAKFHERKRYGKRWSVLTTHLGYGILFLASSELAAAVGKTNVTINDLHRAGKDVGICGCEAAQILHLFNPIAQNLVEGGVGWRDREGLLLQRLLVCCSNELAASTRDSCDGKELNLVAGTYRRATGRVASTHPTSSC